MGPLSSAKLSCLLILLGDDLKKIKADGDQKTTAKGKLLITTRRPEPIYAFIALIVVLLAVRTFLVGTLKPLALSPQEEEIGRRATGGLTLQQHPISLAVELVLFRIVTFKFVWVFCL